MSVLGRLVAVRALDGTVLKGWTADFKPACKSFHVRQEDGSATKVEAVNLKAVFFIKTFAGNPRHDERKDYGTKATPEKKIWIEFTDGECLAGWSSAFAAGPGFYFTPTDPESNLERAYVFRGAVRRILQGDEAVKAAAAHEASSGPASASSSGAGGIFRID